MKENTAWQGGERHVLPTGWTRRKGHSPLLCGPYRGWREIFLFCTHPPPNPQTSPPSKLIHVKIHLNLALLIPSSRIISSWKASVTWVKWKHIYLAWLPLVCHVRYLNIKIQTDTEIPISQIIVGMNQSQSTAYFLEGFILQPLMRYKIKRRLWRVSIITVYINILQESFLPRNLKYLQGGWILPQLWFQQE